jgi:hypothetical protein
MTELPDPRLDQATKYLRGEYFRDQTLDEYISKARHAKMPLGVVLLEIPKSYLAGDSREKTLAELKDLIDNLQIQKDGKRIAFDVKAREDRKYFMVIRVAGLDDCKAVDEVLRHQLQEAGYANARVTAQSFDPANSNIKKEDILTSLEQALK